MCVFFLDSWEADLLDKAMKRSLYLGLVDIIFSYAYQHRTTEGEDNVSGRGMMCEWVGMMCEWAECGM